MLLSVALFVHFHCSIMNHCENILKFIYPFSSSRILGLLPVLFVCLLAFVITNNYTMNILVWVFWNICVRVFLGHIFKSETVGQKDYESWTIQDDAKLFFKIVVSSPTLCIVIFKISHYQMSSSSFNAVGILKFSYLVAIKCYLIVFLIYNSLIANWAENLCICY